MGQDRTPLNFFISGAGRSLYKRKRVKYHVNYRFHTEFYWSRFEALAGVDIEQERGDLPAQGGFLAFSLGFEHYNASFFDSHGTELFQKLIEF